jgi:hypothetical protein
MLTDEQLLQSHVVRGVLERMGNGGLHKTAGAVALGVDEVTLENAVLAICTKIAAQVLKEQRIASGLASLAKTANADIYAGYHPVLSGAFGGYMATPEGSDRTHGTMLGAAGALAAPVGAVAGELAGGFLGPKGQHMGAHMGANLAAYGAGRVLSDRYGRTPDEIHAAENAALARHQAAAEAEAEKTAANPFTTLKNKVLGSAAILDTKIAAQVLKEQRIASGLASLAKTASALAGFSPVLAGTLGGIQGTPEGADPAYGAMLGASGALVAPVGAVAGGLVGSLAGSRGQNAGALIGANLAAFTAGRGASSVHGLTSDAVQAAEEAAFARRRAAAAEAEKTAANPFTAVANRIRGSAKTVPHMAPPPAAAAPIAEGADAVVRGMSPGRMGFAGKVTGAGAGAQVNPGVKSSIPTYMDSYTPQHIPHNPNKAVEVAAASGAPKAKSKATVEGADVGEMPSMFRLDSSAGQTTLAPSARKGGAGILREGGGVAAAQPMRFGRVQVSDQAAPMFNLQEMMARGGKTASILDRIFAA